MNAITYKKHHNVYLIGAALGVVYAVLLQPVFYTVGIVPERLSLMLGIVGPLLVLPLGVMTLLYASRRLNMRLNTPHKHCHRVEQVTRFVLVGGLNTLIDAAVLNLLIGFAGFPTMGTGALVAKALSFSTALINSYVWNARWVFGATHTHGVHVNRAKHKPRHTVASFVLVSLMGMGINVLAFSGIIRGLASLTVLSPSMLLNTALIGATIISLGWNFIGYNVIVFTKKPRSA